MASSVTDDQDFSDPRFVVGAVLAQIEELEPHQQRQVLVDAMTQVAAKPPKVFVCHCTCHLPMGFTLAPGQAPAPIMKPCDECKDDHPKPRDDVNGWGRDDLRRFALDLQSAHDPSQQPDNGYERCAVCHYTRHPCDVFDLASCVLWLLDDGRTDQ
jgi:hypothetical protein